MARTIFIAVLLAALMIGCGKEDPLTAPTNSPKAAHDISAFAGDYGRRSSSFSHSDGASPVLQTYQGFNHKEFL
jgi:hypothetical protein